MSAPRDPSGVSGATPPGPTRSGDAAAASPGDPERAPDDSDVGWGDRFEEHDQDARYREDRPPHWGSD